MQVAANVFYDRIRRRHTVRDFSDRPVALPVVESCIRAAGTSPSGANHQPWHFVAIAKRDIKNRIRLAGMSVARERELGTFEQLLVSPLQPFEIIFGKAVPGLIVGFAQGLLIALIAIFGFGIKLTGSAPVLFAGLVVFLLAVIGVALFISSPASNQQQAMMGIMVFMMPAMMLSGFTSPIQNMPGWLQPVAMINPLTHFIVAVAQLAQPCPCCGGRMFVIETFEAGCQPRYRPTAPLVAISIDTS